MCIARTCTTLKAPSIPVCHRRQDPLGWGLSTVNGGYPVLPIVAIVAAAADSTRDQLLSESVICNVPAPRFGVYAHTLPYMYLTD